MGGDNPRTLHDVDIETICTRAGLFANYILQCGLKGWRYLKCKH